MKIRTLLTAGLIALGMAMPALADDGLDNPSRNPFYDGLKGKRVVFIPLAMGFDLTEGWAAIMRKQAADLGYTLEIRDPNWSTDAGTRALTALIAEKPDLIIAHNPDVQSYARLLKRAMDAGIKVIQLNLESVVPTDAYVGADWARVGYMEADVLVKQCGTGSGKSGKVAIIRGQPTAASDLYELYAYKQTFAKDPAMQIVSEQAAQYDPAKARAIMETFSATPRPLRRRRQLGQPGHRRRGCDPGGGQGGRHLCGDIGRRQPDRLRQHPEGLAGHDRKL